MRISLVPRANWNEIRTYMPGPEYVHAIGLTYYNFGSDTLWDSFDQLYGSHGAAVLRHLFP